MKRTDKVPYKIGSIVELHRLLELPKPLHPLVSLFDNTLVAANKEALPASFLFDFYHVSYKKKLKGRTGYGQHYYDFDDGTLVFTAPNQVISTEAEKDYFGISLLFHADYIRPYALGQQVKRYGFFSYESDEALHLSEPEKEVVLGILKHIEGELQHSIDDYSQDIVVSHLETLLNYSNRFYKRQFVTRKAVNHDLLDRMEKVLAAYFEQEAGLMKGLPTVELLAQELHVSPRYLSDMLRSLTGQNAQQHIHEQLIAKAKAYLSGSSLTVAEIAYQLGFEYPQSFNKLFKKKVRVSPLEYRESFN